MATGFFHNDRELLFRIAGGDEEAFSALYNYYWQKVYVYVESIIKFSSAAEEVTADIFLSLWRHRERLQQVDNFEAYLRTVTRNKALDFIKATARQKQREHIYRVEMALRPAVTPEDPLMDKEVMQFYEAAKAQLSPQRRKIFIMNREEGMTYEQIAQALDISPTTAKKTVFDALAAMKKFLQEHYNQLPMLVVYMLLYQK